MLCKVLDGELGCFETFVGAVAKELDGLNHFLFQNQLLNLVEVH